MKRAVVFLLFLLFCPSSLPAQCPKHLLLGLASISGPSRPVSKKIHERFPESSPRMFQLGSSSSFACGEPSRATASSMRE
jgi:hypothetical protein